MSVENDESQAGLILSTKMSRHQFYTTMYDKNITIIRKPETGTRATKIIKNIMY